MTKRNIFKKMCAIGVSSALLIMSATPIFGAQKQITKEYEFTTTNSNFSYDAPKQITQDGEIYKLSGIRYQQLSKTDNGKSITRHFDNLKTKSVPNSVTENGKTYRLSGTPSYQSHQTSAKTQTVTQTKTYSNILPSEAGSKIQSSYSSGGLNYTKSNESYTTSKNNFNDTTTLNAADENGMVSGLGIRLGLSSPKQGDWYNNFKSYMGYPSYYNVMDAKWVSDVFESGSHFSRQVYLSGYYETRNYTVTYKATKTTGSNSTYYSATATYKDGSTASYRVKAIATYATDDQLQQTTQNTQNQNNNNQNNTQNSNQVNPNLDNNNDDDGIIDSIDPEKFKNKYLPWIIILAALAGAGVGTAIYFANKNNKQKKKEKLEKDAAKKKEKEEEKKLLEEEKARKDAEREERKAKKEKEKLEAKLKKEELKKNPKLKEELREQELDDKIKKALDNLNNDK